MIYKIKEGFVLRKIGPQVMAVPVGKLTSEIHGMIALSESGALLWNLLSDGADKATLVTALLDEYEIDRESAEKDTERFIENLIKQGALE
ncbi:MAG: PqqD family protein [Clostridia bacterium]|nr:PqqD family protein [Clostridia bacterium]